MTDLARDRDLWLPNNPRPERVSQAVWSYVTFLQNLATNNASSAERYRQEIEALKAGRGSQP